MKAFSFLVISLVLAVKAQNAPKKGDPKGVTDVGTPIYARFVRRLGAKIGGHIFDQLSGATTVDSNVYSWVVNSPTPADNFTSISEYNKLPSAQTANVFAVYLNNWGSGMSGSLYGMLNTNLVITGAAGPRQFLAATLKQWVSEYSKTYVDDTTENLCVAEIPSLRKLAIVLGPQIGGLVYGTMGAFAAVQKATAGTNPDSANISPNLILVLQVLVNADTQHSVSTDYDLFNCDTATNGQVCLSDTDLSILGTNTKSLLDKIIGGTYPSATQLDAINALLTSLSPDSSAIAS